MSLLKSLIGAATGAGSKNPGLGALAEIATQNPALLNLAAGMLGAGNKHGGINGLLGKLQAAGLGDVAQSWVDQGPNKPVEAQQLTQALGPDAIQRLAGKAGLGAQDAAALLAQVLPVLVDQITPKGKVPTQAPAGADAILGMLGGMLGKR